MSNPTDDHYYAQQHSPGRVEASMLSRMLQDFAIGSLDEAGRAALHDLLLEQGRDQEAAIVRLNPPPKELGYDTDWEHRRSVIKHFPPKPQDPAPGDDTFDVFGDW